MFIGIGQGILIRWQTFDTSKLLVLVGVYWLDSKNLDMLSETIKSDVCPHLEQFWNDKNLA